TAHDAGRECDIARNRFARRRAMGVRQIAAGRCRDRYAASERVPLPSAAGADAHARRAGDQGRESAYATDTGTAPSSRHIRGADRDRARARALCRSGATGVAADGVRTAPQFASFRAFARSADAALIERVLFNLLENAGKYTPDATLIRIGARVSDDDLLIEVSDQGSGVPASQREAIFDKFTRGARESATPGVGLGLAISRAIV